MWTDLEVIKKWLVDGHRPLSSEKDLLHKIEISHGPKDYTHKYLDIEVCNPLKTLLITNGIVKYDTQLVLKNVIE